MGSEGLKEEEIELELGLSLGGYYRRKVSEPESVDRSVSKTEPEIQDLRRQEVKRKREEKLTNDGFCKENDSNDSVRVKSVPLQGNECEDRDFEEESGRGCKKNKVNDNGLNQNDVGNINQNLPVQYLYPYSYPNPQFVTGVVFPYGNGSLIPCWYGKEGNGVVNPVMSYGFGPFQVRSESGLGNGDDWEQKGSREEEKTKGGSVGSPLCSFSGSSDRKSSSHEGGGSGDTRSHSSCSLPEKWNGSKSSNTKSVSEHSATSPQKDSSQVNEATDPADGLISSNSSQSCLSGPKEVMLETEPNHTNKEILTPADIILGSSKETKREMGKPPKPQAQKQTTPSFSLMPCVSTRGDGPDGKTINGFLHRYTKTEVSIICLCHGTSFSPAEFVQHAGGKDVSHPLRHITVMPPAAL